jgi:topoisomerase-4 subunit A
MASTNFDISSESLPISEFMLQAALTYAMSVVMSRAIPRLQDGMKPVQRRILFDMQRLGVSSSSKHMKVARVVGDTMGKYHPHGDKSISDAMIRMAQDFTLRYPLIDGQGNFGSRDGDGAAAPRYIEARLTGFAELLLSELDQGTVDFIPNYDGAFTEPTMLPARLPFVLLNGAKGMAVGYATDIPSHNLREVATAVCMIIRNPETTLDEIMQVLPAPDFPNGGHIISSPSVIKDAYETGRGSLRMRARWRKEELARGQWRIVFYEMPHEVSTADILSELESITNPKIKDGKKELSLDQKNLKNLFLSMIDKISDGSCKDEPVRLVIDPKSSRQNIDELIAILLAHTSLESSVSLNMVVLGNDGNPNCKGLKFILQEWVAFRFMTVERRLRSRLTNVESRLHILGGRMLAFASLDAVIKTIREADDPKSDLIEKFALSVIQAEDILEIRLRQLARLEGFKIEKEIKDLNTESDKLNHLLSNRKALTNLILSEIESDQKKHGDDRRTFVEAVVQTRLPTVTVSDEPITVILSQNGWIRSRLGHNIDRPSISYKSGDAEFVVLETRTTLTVCIIDTNGRAYSIKVSDLPGGRGDGVPVTSLMDVQTGVNGIGKVAHAFVDAPDSQYFFSNSGGYGFISSLSDLLGRNKAGKTFMTIEKDEIVLHPSKVDGDSIYAMSIGGKESRLLMFPISEMKVIPKGRGVIIMKLVANESLGFAVVAASDRITIEGTPKNIILTAEQIEQYKMHRASKGNSLPMKINSTKII